ncbi:hypothetical protein L1D14_04115 [Vibrio tubiashii]|uniref:hypothetical protein n=1 Tax=Vibrio tubiashii TaxID=29498 RepID=UPI001EFD89CC|nr:hypothetical protein [Vibrio tubiashii]MCG9575416.1 hypothetical protein [Vibrio tubiashii]
MNAHPCIDQSPVFSGLVDIEHDFAVSARTSIARRGASAPLKHLIKLSLIPKNGSCLNFGKGRDNHDSDAIRAISGHCQDYDYTYHKADVFGSSFRFVYAGYVQNTLPPEARDVVWRQLARVTHMNEGVCYVAVRSDTDKGIKGVPFADGVRTRRLNTFQKGYSIDALVNEASRYFKYYHPIQCSGFRLIECRHALQL